MRRALLMVALVVATASAPAIGGSKKTTETSKLRAIGGLAFVDEVEVTVVNVAAHVTDRKGRPVTDLRREDFRILQDGEEKPVTNFEVFTEAVYRSRVETPSAATPALGPTPAPPPEAAPRPRPVFLVIYVDNDNLHPLDRNRVLSQAREFVRANLHPPVEMMVASHGKSLKIVQPFTSDQHLVLEALRDLRRVSGGWPERESTRREIFDDLQRYLQEEGTRGGAAARTERDYRYFYHRIIAFAEEEHNNLSFTADALRQMIGTIAGLEGKKGIVYVSNGLAMVPGLDLFTAFVNTYHDQAIMTEISRFDRSKLFKSLVDTANAQDVTFYTIGAGGLEVVGMAGAEYASPIDAQAASLGASNYVDSLRFIADGTGGLAVVNTNDFTAGLDRIEQDLYTYYSLGYALNTSGQDKVHRVKVELPGHPEYTIRYRRRFVEKSIESKVQDKVFSGLTVDLDENPLGMRFEAGTPSPASEERWMVPVHVSFPLDRIALIPEGDDYVGRLELFLAARDSGGKQSDLVRQQHEVRVPAADYEEAKSKAFGIGARLLMNSGAYRVSIGLLDLVTHQASFETTRTRIGGD